MTLFCGCYIVQSGNQPYQRTYLPQVRSKVHTTIESTFYRTVLTQVYSSGSNPLPKVVYCFPLFEGVSVVDFRCQIGERLIRGVVKERGEAKKTYVAAVERGESAGLLEQSLNSSDVFQTSLGNVPANSEVIVTVSYVGELKHDAEVNGVRLTIPTVIAPRYGSATGTELLSSVAAGSGNMEIVVDMNMSEGSPIKSIQSPSHPISVSIGTLSTAPYEDPEMTKGSATLSLGSTVLEKDFVLQLVTKAVGKPYALLETHPTIPNQRAIMATLVPNFSLKPERPEILFVSDRSGSMRQNIPTLKSALHVFLKSLPLGVRFNLWSFGSHAKPLWPRSMAYSQESVEEAARHVDTYAADFGGTETLKALKHTIESREKKLPTEVILLTDGDIWQQQELFDYLQEQIEESDTPIRVFPLGIGNGVSSALIEGVARAGNGFSQSVMNQERMEGKIVRMLKGALSPHFTDCALEIKYSQGDDDDFEIVEKVTDETDVKLALDEGKINDKGEGTRQKPIAIYDDERMEDIQASKDSLQTQKSKYAHLPVIDPPKLLQVPHKIPALFPFNRTSVYILLSPEAEKKNPEAVIFRAKCEQGPLELEMKIKAMDEPGETIHQLAAKKAIQELEEGRGWLRDAKERSGERIKETQSARFEDIVEHEAVRLGVQFQVGGKWCSFVAVEGNDVEILERKKQALQNKSLKLSSEDRLSGDTVIQDFDISSFEFEESEDEQPRQMLQDVSVSRCRRGPAKKKMAFGGSLFGARASAAQPPPAPSGSSFSGGPYFSPSTESNPHPVFGSNPGGSQLPPASGGLFGASNQAAQTPSASFGAPQMQSAAAPTGFGSSISSLFRSAPKYDRVAPINRKGAPDDPMHDEGSPNLDPVSQVVNAQKFAGNWGPDVLPHLKLDIASLGQLTKALAASGILETALVQSLSSTATAIAFLEEQGGNEGGYELMIEKARDWMEESLKMHNVGPDVVEQLVGEARKLI